MSPRNRLELLRGWVEGTLPDDERRAFERELERDPELAELAAAYDAVVDATRDGPVPASTTSFDDLALRARPPWRWIAVAAAAAVVVLAVLASLPDAEPAEPGGPATVRLAAVTLKEEEAAQPPETRLDPPPARAATYRPDDGETIDWIGELDQALAVARWADRPVLLFIDYPGCPLCAKYDREVFPAEAVRAAADGFVLARLSWNEAPRALRASPRNGWPLFPVLDHGGRRIDGFVGFKSPADLGAWLTATARRTRETGGFRPLPWERVNRLAERARRTPPSHADLAAMRVADPDGPFGAFARNRLQAMDARAGRALVAARDAAPDEARRILREALNDGLAGTPYGRDLETVLDSLGKTGAFPRLEAAK